MLRRLIAAIAASTFALLALAVVPALAGGGCVNDNPTTEGSGTSVEMKNCGFAPTIIRVPVGATVTWTNQEEHLPHVVSGVGWGQKSHGDYLSPGRSQTQRFAAAGVYPYTCFIHPGMSGAVIVGDANAPASGAAPAAVTPAPTPDLASATRARSTPAPARSGDSLPWPGIALGLSVAASAVAYAAGRAGRGDR